MGPLLVYQYLFLSAAIKAIIWKIRNSRVVIHFCLKKKNYEQIVDITGLNIFEPLLQWAS